ncbi:amino acid permease [Ramlibacter rhizophilus]|uniref:amino acid permease n=1 Tax=Ramlibacter rhizophilus TaxID=1781167 RepID=UPI00143255F5|nr:amino acid permease [Ramlibacter rhizophilus]
MPSTSTTLPLPPAAGARLGTFAGVFTPSILTILGIVLFLRLGYIVGGSGLAQALLVLAAAHVITVLTALSVAAIATNLQVRAGGDYYLISRTLGPGFGAAIGLVLFLAQAVSIGFYAIGFAEALAPLVLPGHAWAPRAIALAAVGALGLLAWRGADLATRFQYVVMVLLVAGIAVFVAGAAGRWDASTLLANWPAPRDSLPFWVAFAIFFPAVTGFTQGVSMSGDLAAPGRSIPSGVLGAVGVSALVYLACALLFAAALPAAELRGEGFAMRELALWGPLIDLGVMAATLSSALASFMGAPRILQSLASDGIFRWLAPFAAVNPADSNPRRAVGPTLLVAAGIVALGDLNLVASVVSMFFLVSYGLLNYATWHEARSSSPSFRPTFRFYDRRLGLAGALACLGAMLAVDLRAGVVATLIVYAIYRWVERQDLAVQWSDGRRAYHLQLAREHLLEAAAEPEHARAWRPQLLVFSDSPQRRARLLAFASWVEGGAGMTTVVRLLAGDRRDVVSQRQQEAEQLAAEIRDADSTAFPLVVVGDDADSMLSSVVQSAGIGPMRTNTVVANWPVGENKQFYDSLGVGGFGERVATAFRLGANLLLLDATDEEWTALSTRAAAQRTIDVWWQDSPSGELMLLLAYLSTRSTDWHEARIRLLASPAPGASDEACGRELEERLEQVRIPAEVVIVPTPSESVVVQASRGSDLVFLPFRVHAGRFYSPFGWEVGPATRHLPITVLCLAAQEIDLEAEPDDGVAPAPTASAQ